MSPAQRRVWAHPRVGGENQVRAGRDGRLSGSSPRRRGKHLGEVPVEDGSGLIPA